MKKQIEFVFLVIRIFVKRHRKIIFLGFLAGFLLTLCSMQFGTVYSNLFKSRNKRIGLVGQFTDTSLPLSVQSLISRGLTVLAEDGEAKPSLASSWEADPNSTTYIFHLRSDIFWHDGKKLTAKEIKYKLKGVEFTSVNENTLKVSLKEKYAPLPVFLSKPVLRDNLIGVGDYRVTKIIYSEENISELKLASTKKDLPSLTYKFYSGTEEAILAFKMGEVDMLWDIPEIGNLKLWKNTKITEINQYDRYVGLFFNLKNSLFKEKEVRQALAYAVPAIPNYDRAISPFSPLSWAYSNKVRQYHYDPELSRKVLQKSPLTSASAQLTLSTYASFLPLAQKIVDTWKEVGVAIRIKVENTLPSDYQILLTSWAIPPDPDQYYSWQSTQDNTNITHYNNLKIDKLLEDGRQTLDKEKRIKIYADFQRYLLEDVPVIPLYYPKTYLVERTD